MKVQKNGGREEMKRKEVQREKRGRSPWCISMTLFNPKIKKKISDIDRNVKEGGDGDLRKG